MPEQLDKEQIKNIKKAYALHGKILGEIQELGRLNISLAFGLLGVADTMLEFEFCRRLHAAVKAEQKPPEGR